MMDFELKLTKPSRKYSCLEGLVMGIAYFIGQFAFISQLMRN